MERKDQILLINLSKYFVKQAPKNALTDEGIDAASEVYQAWKSREKLSQRYHIWKMPEKTDYNLSSSQFVDVGDKIEHRSVNEILVDFTEARIAREKADKTLEDVLTGLGFSEVELQCKKVRD